MSGRRGGRRTGRQDRSGAAGAGGAAPPAAEPGVFFKIEKIAAFGFELGPIEFRRPRHFWRALGLTLVPSAVVMGGLYFVFLHHPMESARAALRIARYDTALTRLKAIPDWLSGWPGLDSLREKAQLGDHLNTPPQDWSTLGQRLHELSAQAPADADLLVLEAALAIKGGDFSGAGKSLETAVTADPANAQAWFLLGLVHDLTGEDGDAIAAYRRAVDLAPQSPQYRSNLARTLLDGGAADAAIEQYRQISQFPLARIEQALAHWARGEWGEAAEAQRAALAMLDDAKLMDNPANRLGWRFELRDQAPPNNGVQLASLADKRCYALLGQAVSRRLAGKPWVLPKCGSQEVAPLAIRRLVADDLCRFVDHYQPALKPAASALRRALDQPVCAPPPAAGARRAGRLTQG